MTCVGDPRSTSDTSTYLTLYGTMKTLVRPYRPGDETPLVSLWREVYATNGGFVPRTPSYWRSNILDRPNVEHADIQILHGPSGTILGFGVLGPGGDVLEFAVTRKATPSQRRACTQQLLTALERRARHHGYETIQLRLLASDRAVSQALSNLGYRSESTRSLQLVIVDLASFCAAILQHRQPEFPEQWASSFRVNLEPGNYRFCPHRTLNITVDPPSVIANVPDQGADCTISMDVLTMMEIAFGLTTVHRAFDEGCIAVSPKSTQSDAVRLLSQFVIRGDWYSPLADAR